MSGPPWIDGMTSLSGAMIGGGRNAYASAALARICSIGAESRSTRANMSMIGAISRSTRWRVFMPTVPFMAPPIRAALSPQHRTDFRRCGHHLVGNRLQLGIGEAFFDRLQLYLDCQAELDLGHALPREAVEQAGAPQVRLVASGRPPLSL